ncbi:MAG: hypothetical protein ACLFUQ_04810 [Candidatus Izemoplasmataceae bacterium]
MKHGISRIIGLIMYYLLAYLAYHHVYLGIMEGFETTGFLGGDMTGVTVIFETVLIQNTLGMVLFALVVVYELVMILLRR